MTDKHLNKDSLLNVSCNPCCFNFDKYFFSRITAFQHKRAFFVFRCMFCFELVTTTTTKYHSRISDLSNYSTVKFYVRIRSTDGNIQDCLLLNVISDVTQSLLQFVQTCEKQNFQLFCRFFSIFKVEYLENSLAYFNDFGLILKNFEQPLR